MGRGQPPDFVWTRSISQGWSSKRRDADDDRMKHEAQRQIDDRADDDGDDVFRGPANRNRRRAWIRTILERDAVVYRPGEHRSEQDHTAEIAISTQMRESPSLHPGQHRMFEHALDVARNIG